MIMKGKYLLRGIRNLLLGALLVFGVTAFSSTDANAQARFRGGFRGGGFHTRVFIGPRFGYPYRYWYGYPYPYAYGSVSYTHLRAHETPEHLVCRLLLEKK